MQYGRNIYYEQKTNFPCCLLDQLDHTGHHDGHDTPAYYQKLEELDTYVGRIVEAIKKAGIYDDTIIILTADHGGIKKGHGGKTLQEMEIPFIIAGKNVKQYGEFKEMYDAVRHGLYHCLHLWTHTATSMDWSPNEASS